MKVKGYVLIYSCCTILSMLLTALFLFTSISSNSSSEVLNKTMGLNEETNRNRTMPGNTIFQSDPANQAESMMAPFLNPMSIMSSAIDQIRNSTGSGGHNNLNNNTNSSIVRDSTTVLLGMKVIPARDFIPLYDSNPYKIMNGHLTAKLPCDLKSESQLKILVGHVPNLKAVQLEVVKELSKPGYMCLYQLNLLMQKATTLPVKDSSISNSTFADDMILFNPTNSTIKLPHTSTIVIGVDEISS